MKTKNYTYNEKNEKRRRENRDCMRKVKIKRGIFRHPPWWLFIKSTRVIGELLDSM